jgi:hypothetical protein
VRRVSASRPPSHSYNVGTAGFGGTPGASDIARTSVGERGSARRMMDE